MSIEVYKVLWKKGDELWSGGISEKGVAMRYSLDEVNYPCIPRSYLFAFRECEDAHNWICENGWPSRVVYPAETPSIVIPKSMLFPRYLSAFGLVNKFWECPDDHPDKTWPLPYGTVFCPSLKFLV